MECPDPEVNERNRPAEMRLPLPPAVESARLAIVESLHLLPVTTDWPSLAGAVVKMDNWELATRGMTVLVLLVVLQ